MWVRHSRARLSPCARRQQLLPERARLCESRRGARGRPRGRGALQRRATLSCPALPGLELRRLAQRVDASSACRDRVDLAERGGALARLGNHELDASPGLRRLLLSPAGSTDRPARRCGSGHRERAREALQYLERLLLLLDPLVEIRNGAREVLFVGAALRSSALEQPCAAVATLNQRVAQLERVVGIVRRGADERLVFADGRSSSPCDWNRCITLTRTSMLRGARSSARR